MSIRKVIESAKPVEEKERKFTLIPTPGRVIVIEDAFTYTGLIAIPEVSKRRPTTGKVIAIGYGVGRWETQEFRDPKNSDSVIEQTVLVPLVNLGDKLVYGLYSGTVINFKGQPAFRILNQDEILAIIEGEAEFEGAGV